jgi:thymidylate synthase ThyX
MGIPRSEQLQGTPREMLCELAGRVCYDSLGTGRPSFSTENIEGYHDHIKSSGHGSVLEHAAITIEMYTTDLLDPTAEYVMKALFGFPGVYIKIDPACASLLRITFNPRVVRDWDKIVARLETPPTTTLSSMKYAMEYACSVAMPNVFPAPVAGPYTEKIRPLWSYPKFECEKWVSIWMCGSRGFSHEQVRHKWHTAVSQRSTRYVDESESAWVVHPLTAKFEADFPNEVDHMQLGVAKLHAKSAYEIHAEHLQQYLCGFGVDKIAARKQARGAARGYLGNALETQMIFSANVAQWKEMLRQRLSAGADAEIRYIYAEVLQELKRCRYSDSFAAFQTRPSPDGIGEVLV